MKAVMLVLVLGLVIGCGKKSETEPQGQANAPVKPAAPVSKENRPKTSPKTPLKPEPKATNKKTVPVLWEFETGDAVSSSPAIGSDGTIYVGSSDKKLYAIASSSKGLADSPWPMRGQNARHAGWAQKK